MDFDFSLLSYVIFFATGLLAGFVDAIAGGGGLIGIPTLLSFGIPPTLALGTNKLQGTFGSFTAMLNYRKAKLFRLRDSVFGIVSTAVGAWLGTFIVQHLSTNFLNILIPILLIVIFFYFLLSPKLGEKDKHARLQHNSFFLIFGLALGFYDGFFGPGAGSLWTFAFVTVMGLNLKKATAHTKVMNFTSNIVSLTTFILGGFVIFNVGLTMALGQFIGAFAGSHLVIQKGTKLIRIFFLIVVGATLVKMFITL